VPCPTVVNGYGVVDEVAASQAVLIVTSIFNIHHFVIDGVMWKRPTPSRLKPAPAYS
jgi:hypothetical protein